MIWEILDHNIQALDYSAFHAIVGIGPNFAPNAEGTSYFILFSNQYSVTHVFYVLIN